ncbi:hypothetical protein GIB67_011146 [Kingdonia uniflora]|uniref:Uncharacterized protein n=1 Tax=Kingdonia uniflora TaxID=39325 RepID=A0A7J7PAA5_9MAGN|nr:hypothetical protein GIB67_011146 [Kingdonia uniflora]
MVSCGSVSILSLTTTATSTTTKCITTRRIKHLKSPSNPKPNPRYHHKLRIRASSANQSSSIVVEDGETEQFLQSNSIGDFMRFKRGERQINGELQTAVVSYRKKFPWSLFQPFLQVDLVSTIHIADKDYFTTLQKELETYDCVLYEMVASKESLENRRNPAAMKRLKGSRPSGFNIISFIQRQMSSILTLDFQLDCLDYEGESWYHADLDFETFKLLQVERGESFFTFARDMTLKSTKAMIQPAPVSEDLGPWRSKLLWASRVFPMPLVGLLLIGSLCADMGSQSSDYPELEALSRLDFGAAMKIFLAKRLASEQNVKLNILELDGKANAYGFMEWFNRVDRISHIRNASGNKANRKLKTVDEYVNEFYLFSSRVATTETGAHKLNRFKSGLARKIHDGLTMVNIYSVAEAVEIVKRVETNFTQATTEVEENSVIIGERNRVATEALERAIQKGHNRIAVLYGGGHMPDLGRRLREDFDLVPSKVQWVTAWSIRNRELNNGSIPFLRTLAKVSGWPLNRYQTAALLIFSSVLALDLWFWELFFGSAVNWVSGAASEISQFAENTQVM